MTASLRATATRARRHPERRQTRWWNAWSAGSFRMTPFLEGYNEPCSRKSFQLLVSFYFVLGSESSGRAKWVVALLAAGSSILQFAVPALWLLRLILQVLFCIGILFYFQTRA
jgi:hypothetical protein